MASSYSKTAVNDDPEELVGRIFFTAITTAPLLEANFAWHF